MQNRWPVVILPFSILLLVGIVLYLISQDAFVLSNENLWSTGKIFVVIAVVALIFVGIIFFLLHLESKLSDLETRLKDKN